MRIGKSTNHVVRIQLIQNITPIQQKVRGITIHLRERVKTVLNKLINKKHIKKLDKCSEQQFISPNVITVKNVQTGKIALDSKKMNKCIHKNRDQMTNIEFLLDNIPKTIKADNTQQTVFIHLDLLYAYSRIPLDKQTKDQSNFSLIGGKATGTIQFQTGFYGLRDMPEEFQKALDLTLTNCENTFAYLDDILIVTKGSKATNKKLFYKVLEKLNDENLGISLEKCNFAREQIVCLGYNISSEGATPLPQKTGEKLKISSSKISKQVNFHGSFQTLPNLAEISEPRRNSIHIKNTAKKLRQLRNIRMEAGTNIRLAKCPKTRIWIYWRQIFQPTLRYLISLRRLCIWAMFCFRAYYKHRLRRNSIQVKISKLIRREICGKLTKTIKGRLGHRTLQILSLRENFTVITDHRALVSSLNANKSSKTSKSRLTRWNDRLIPFAFDISHLAWAKMGLIEHMSRNPLGLALSPAIMMRNLVWRHFFPIGWSICAWIKKRNAAVQLSSQGHFKLSEHNRSGRPTQNENNHSINCTRQKQQTNLKSKWNLVYFLSTLESRKTKWDDETTKLKTI